MNAKTRRVAIRFAPETRFQVAPVPSAPFRAATENRFEELKRRLLVERIEQEGTSRSVYLRQAANEATSLAWATPYPLLVYPALFEEKVADSIVRAALQARVLRKSRVLLAA